MRVWTNGTRHILLNEHGLQIWDGDEHISVARFACESSFHRGALAVTPRGHMIWAHNQDQNLVQVPLAQPDQAHEHTCLVEDAVALDDERIAAVYAERPGGELHVGVGTPSRAASGCKWLRPMELPTPRHVQWPRAIWATDREPWSEQSSLGTQDASLRVGSGAIRIANNRFGVTLVDRNSGIVALLRPGATSFEACLRVPAQEEAMIHAVPTPHGVLVSLAVEGRESALCHFDAMGECLEYREFWGMGPALLLDAHRILVAAWKDYGTGPLQVRVLDLDTFEERDAVDLDFEASSPELDADVSDDGRCFIIGGANTVRLGCFAGGKLKMTRISEQDSEAPPEAITAGLSLSVLEPCLQLDAAAGDQVELNVKLSHKGVADALVILVHGGAIDDELVDFEEVELKVTTPRSEKTYDAELGFVAIQSRVIGKVEFPQLGLRHNLQEAVVVVPGQAPVEACADTLLTLTFRGYAMEAGRQDLHLDLYLDDVADDPDVSMRTQITVTNPSRRPLRCADEQDVSASLRAMNRPRVLLALVSLTANPAENARVAAAAFERWSAAIGLTDQLIYRTSALDRPHSAATEDWLTIAEPRARHKWMKLRMQLAKYVHFHAHLVADPLADVAEDDEHASGFAFDALPSPLGKSDKDLAVHLGLWVDLEGRTAEEISTLTQALREIVSDTVEDANALQAFVTKWDWIPNGLSECTPYEMACGIRGQRMNATAWCTRSLRAAAEDIWLGPDLQSQLDLTKLDLVAQVTPVGEAIHLRLSPDATLDHLEETLAPVLAGVEQWRTLLNTRYQS